MIFVTSVIDMSRQDPKDSDSRCFVDDSTRKNQGWHIEHQGVSTTIFF
jgi:hypothetical protein